MSLIDGGILDAMHGEQRASDLSDIFSYMMTGDMQNALASLGPGTLANRISNCYRTPAQRKLDAAREYLKSRADAHPEWRIEKTSATAERMWKEANVGSYAEISR